MFAELGQPLSQLYNCHHITLFDALEKQLGLKLVRTKVSTPAIVVDSVRKPTVDVTESGSSQPVAFEVASIKPADPDIRGGNVAIERGGRVRITMTLKDLVWEAWGNLNTERIVGGPSFMDTTIWVVVAKAPAKDDGPAGWVGPVWNGVDLNTMRMMLRARLVDRFKLSVHMEDRQVGMRWWRRSRSCGRRIRPIVRDAGMAQESTARIRGSRKRRRALRAPPMEGQKGTVAEVADELKVLCSCLGVTFSNPTDLAVVPAGGTVCEPSSEIRKVSVDGYRHAFIIQPLRQTFASPTFNLILRTH